MNGIEQHSHRRFRLVALAVLLVVAGAVALVVAIRAQRHAPQPPASAAIPYSAPPASGNPVPAPPTAVAVTKPRAAVTGPVLAASRPIRLDVPAIRVTSELLDLGLNPDHTVEVPPLDRDSKAGWYRYSPTPGQLGPAIILGHVDSAEYGPGIFFQLGALRPGDSVTVTRADRTAAVFRVDRVVAYPKDHFPTLEVYGNTDHAALRLITCGGKFDTSTHNYESNIVAYATLISSHPA